jgi:hypothetical protein
MFDIFLMLACLAGYVFAAIRWLRIKPSHAPFFAVSCAGVVLYLLAISDLLQTGTSVMILSGVVLCMAGCVYFFQTRHDRDYSFLLKGAGFFLVLTLAGFILTIGMNFTVVDDYVYWGSLGKYLFLTNHLPGPDCPLDPRTLGYTPGTGLIHYFFYLLSGRYNVHMSYFAQNMLLISAIFVVVNPDQIKKSAIRAGVLIVLLTVFYGSIFTKLQVDYLISVFLFAVFWIYISESNFYTGFLTVSMPLLFMFLIKEIGIVVTLFALGAMLADVFAGRMHNPKNRIWAVIFIVLTAAGVFMLRLLWIRHVNEMGFVKFDRAIQWDSIKSVLHIFSDDRIRNGFMIFIGQVFAGGADRLNIPYFVWYAVLGFLGYRIFKDTETRGKTRILSFFSVGVICFGIYLFMLYCLELIVFSVGISNNHAIGFSRYFNIVFAGIVFIAAVYSLDKYFLASMRISAGACAITCASVILVLVLSRFEISLHMNPYDAVIKDAAMQIKAAMNNETHSVGVISGTPDDVSGLKFLYHLLPDRVDYHVRNFRTPSRLDAYAAGFDYIIVIKPDAVILEWIRSLCPANRDYAPVGEIGFFAVKKGGLKNNVPDNGTCLLENIPVCNPEN